MLPFVKITEFFRSMLGTKIVGKLEPGIVACAVIPQNNNKIGKSSKPAIQPCWKTEGGLICPKINLNRENCTLYPIVWI